MVAGSTLCSLCNREAFFSQPYSGRAFCLGCYPKAFEKRVQDHVNRGHLLRPDDRIAVAVSGGKDSVSLLHVLAQLEEEYPKVELVAVSIDEGVEGYRGEALEIAAENAEALGIKHHVLCFKSLYGRSLDEIAEAARAKGNNAFCALCGILRRKALNVMAKNLGASVLATAHNLDDEAQSFLMSILRGDMRSIGGSQGQVEGLVRRVKPFALIPEREVVLYAWSKGIRFQSVPCPYAGTSLRNDVRVFLDTVETKHPGMKFNVQAAAQKIDAIHNVRKGDLRPCVSCGEPSSSGLCRSCQLLREMGIL